MTEKHEAPFKERKTEKIAITVEYFDGGLWWAAEQHIYEWDDVTFTRITKMLREMCPECKKQIDKVKGIGNPT